MTTVALLHFDNNLTDSGASPHTYTAAGGAAASSAQSKFGGYSLLLASASSQWLTTPDHADFVFGTGDFCIDAWIRTSTVAGQIVVDRYTGSAGAWQVWINASSKLVWYTNASIKVSTDSVTTGSWVHIEISRTSGTLYMFVDGVLQGSGLAHAQDYNVTTTSLAVGVQVTGSSNKFNGYIDELRIQKGVGGHITTFTPPTAAYFLPSISGAVLDDTGAAAERTVRLYSRATGQLLNSTVSTGGVFSFTAEGTDQHYVVALDDAGGTNYNALIFDQITPA